MTTDDVTAKKQRPDWKNIIHKWLTSNFSISSYCREHKLSPATFHYWRARFSPGSKRKCKKDFAFKQQFVPIQVCNNEENKGDDFILLQYPNGCSVRLNGDFNPKLLRLINEAMGI
jgi:hypothetical protein